MPTVTNISQQQRRKDRFSVYLDGSYRLSLAQNQLVDAGLRVGDELTEARINELAKQSEVGKALDRAYNYLSFRSRSRQEMVRYFRRKQYDDELTEFLVAQLEEQALVDDARFARDWVEARQQSSPRSVIQLRAELREKGIAADTIADVLDSQTAVTETATIIALIEQKRLWQRYPDKQKLIRYLAGKGFGFTVIQDALEQLIDTEVT